jgi:DNA-binding protein YbaB
VKASDIDRVRARRDELVNLMQRTRALVEDAEDALGRADALNGEFERATWTQEIRPGLGTLTIDGRGRLGDLRLDAGAVRRSDPARLGERVLAAIHEAESRAAGERSAGLAQIFRYVGD